MLPWVRIWRSQTAIWLKWSHSYRIPLYISAGIIFRKIKEQLSWYYRKVFLIAVALNKPRHGTRHARVVNHQFIGNK